MQNLPINIHPMLYMVLFLFSLPMKAMAIEEPSFTRLKQDGNFELREYESYIIAETLVTKTNSIKNQADASRIGFKRIANYIFGNNSLTNSGNNSADNATSKKIAMTAPVTISNNLASINPADFKVANIPQAQA